MIRQARRVAISDCLSWIVLGLVLIIGALWIGYATNLPYFMALFNGGTDFSTAEIENYGGSLPVYFASVRGSQMYETGYTLDTEPFTSFGTYREYFGALAVGDRLLLVKSSTVIDEKLLQYTGSLEAMPSDFVNNLVNDMVREQPELEGTFLPYYLNLDGVAQNWHWYAGALSVVATTLIGIYLLATGADRLQHPLNHPVLKNLKRYGIEVEVLLNQIDVELQMSTEQIGALRMSRHWLVLSNSGVFEVMRIDDLVWIYKYIEITRYYGIIRISKQVKCMFWDRQGALLQVPIAALMKKEQAAEQMMHNVAQRAPWAIQGFSPQISQLWQKSRGQFLGEVAARKNNPPVPEGGS